MTEKQMKNYVIILYKHKKINDSQFRKAVNYLEKLRDSDQLFYYFNMGKLHTAFGNAEEAIFYLEKSITLKPDNSSAYYNLYKCYVKTGNIGEAIESLRLFFEHNKHDVDFSFVLQIMRAMLFLDKSYLSYLNSEFNVYESTKVGYNDLSDNMELLEVYKSVIQAFNNRDYSICLKKLHVMNRIIMESNYPMDVDTLVNLIKLLKIKEINSCKRVLSDSSIEQASNEQFCKCQLRLLELGHYHPESFLRMVGENINKDVSRAKKLLVAVQENPKFYSYLDMIEYLNGIIREKEAFIYLSDDKQNEFITRRLKAKKLYMNRKNEQALKEYQSLKEDFGLLLCDYYIGKILLFRQGSLLQAKESFLSYLIQGGIKAEKAYMFLGMIEKKQKNYGDAKKYIGMMHRIHNVFVRDYDYIPDKNYNKKRKNDKYDQCDNVKRNESRKIKMKEADFAQNDVQIAGDFYDMGLSDKLIVIRKLLRNGNDKLANKLYEEVQRECTQGEREEVEQFGRNRKLYKNQNRSVSS